MKALEFNHINGGGCKETKNHNILYRDIINEKRNDIELTCKVCNALHCLVKLKKLPNKWKITYDGIEK